MKFGNAAEVLHSKDRGVAHGGETLFQDVSAFKEGLWRLQWDCCQVQKKHYNSPNLATETNLREKSLLASRRIVGDGNIQPDRSQKKG